MSRMLFIFFSLILCSSQAFASILLEGVSGASRDNLNEDRDQPVIWAGTVGLATTCTDVCNNCMGGLQDCNEYRIDDSGNLTLSFRSDARSGIPIATDVNKQTIIGSIIPNAPIVNANETTDVQIPWSQICAQAPGCDRNGRISIVIGIDGSNNGEGNRSLNDSEDDSLQVLIEIRSQLPNEGIETFTLFPGDEKFYMLTPNDPQLIDGPNIIFPNSFPVYENNTITEIRFYYEEVVGEEDFETALGRITNNSTYVRTEVINIGTGDDIELSKHYFTESDGPDGKQGRKFENDSKYVFKIALVDDAGNIGLFRDNLGGVEEIEARQVVVPSRVIGALKRSNFLGCFIATAVYGRSHRMLKTFYQFRDQKLLPYSLGRIIHDLYYTYSPPLADIIRDNIFLKYIARILLIPFWIYAFLVLQIGHILTFVLLTSLISTLMYFLIKKQVVRLL